MKALIEAAALTLASGLAWGQCITTNGHLIANQTITGDCPAGSVPIFASSSAPANLIASRPARTYTLDEIDRMRAAVMSEVENEYCLKGDGAIMNCPFPPSMAPMAEDRLRTYIAAGISPEVLEAKVKERK